MLKQKYTCMEDYDFAFEQLELASNVRLILRIRKETADRVSQSFALGG